MTDPVTLTAQSPAAGMLPIRVGPLTLSEVDPTTMTALIPRKGAQAALGAALKQAHDVALPGNLRAAGRDGQRVIWFGLNQWLLIGPAPDASLAQHAALSDQSDAWAVLRLEGGLGADVLARLAPVDLRQQVFKRGHTLRTLIGHMPASITRLGDKALMLMVFRSMAGTLVHELETAMEAVVARG